MYHSQPGSSQKAEVSTPQTTRARGDPQRISLLDAFGDRREGAVLRAMRWDDATAADIERHDGDFSIVILSEPVLSGSKERSAIGGTRRVADCCPSLSNREVLLKRPPQNRAPSILRQAQDDVAQDDGFGAGQ